MKTKIFKGWKVVLALSAVPLLAGSIVGPQTQKEIDEVSTNAATAVPITNVPTEADLTETDSDSNEFTDTNVVPAELPRPAAADVKLSPGAAEIVKMAEAGVDEQVMISFATNYSSRFNLDSDQIIYLNDLGISGDVVRTMIQRDAALAEAAVAQAATNNVPQVATNYIAGADATNLYYPPTNYNGPVMDLGYNPNYTSYDTGAYAADADYDYFGESLAPYGSWIYISGYGRCWRPTVAVVNTGWQPYCDRGRWIYTDCGWYWQSDYSWGWAPFHYGRWFCDTRHGWVWRPGRVWGPAWVSWRRSNDYCGWAPLPPEAHFVPGHGFSYWNHSVGVSFDFGLRRNHYTFVPVNRFCDYAPYRYRVSPTQITKVYNNTVVINNITVKDHKVINHGIDPKRVEQASRTEIRKAVIRDGALGKDKTVKPEHFAKDGNELVIFRPKLPPRQGASSVAGGNGGQNGTSRGKDVVVGGPKSPSGHVPAKNFYTPKTVEAFPATKPQTVPTQPGSIKTAGPKQPIDPKQQAATDKNHNPAEGGVPTVIKPGPGSTKNNLVDGSKAPTVPSLPSSDNVRPHSPPGKQQPGSIFLNGKNSGNASADPVPPNSLVLSGPKNAANQAQETSGNVPVVTKNPGFSQPRTVGTPGSTLPNMNMADQQREKIKEFQSAYGNYLNSRSQPSGGNSSQPNAAQNTVSKPNAGYQPLGQQGNTGVAAQQSPRWQELAKPSSSSSFSKPNSLAEAPQAQPQWTMPSRSSGNDGSVQRPSGAQSSPTYQPFSQQTGPKVVVPQAPRVEAQQPARWQDYAKPSAPSSPSKPQWTMPAQSSGNANSGNSAPRESASPRSFSAPPAVRSAPAQSQSTPSVRSSSSGGSSSGSSRSASSGNSSGNSSSSRSSSSSPFSKKP